MPLETSIHTGRRLVTHGHQTSMKMVARLLKELGYSLQANRKRLEGAQHPDRNAQFEHINETIRRPARGARAGDLGGHEEEGAGGRRTRTGAASSAPRAIPRTSVSTTSSATDGKVAPYGVYDLQQNEAWVSVGISHDTAEFAVRDDPHVVAGDGGARVSRTRTSLVITADGGGSNGYRLRLWKLELQRLADELGLPDHRLSSAAGHEQVEQDRASPVLVHHAELARQTAHHPSGDREPDRRHDDDDRLVGPQPTR